MKGQTPGWWSGGIGEHFRRTVIAGTLFDSDPVYDAIRITATPPFRLLSNGKGGRDGIISSPFIAIPCRMQT